MNGTIRYIAFLVFLLQSVAEAQDVRFYDSSRRVTSVEANDLITFGRASDSTFRFIRIDSLMQFFDTPIIHHDSVIVRGETDIPTHLEERAGRFRMKGVCADTDCLAYADNGVMECAPCYARDTVWQYILPGPLYWHQSGDTLYVVVLEPDDEHKAAWPLVPWPASIIAAWGVWLIWLLSPFSDPWFADRNRAGHDLPGYP